MKKPTVLLGLNELNFDFIKHYIAAGSLPNFQTLFSDNKISVTKSETEYHLLEPWIQWVTIQTGKSYSEHQIFRLGDIVTHPELPQIYETLEASGHTIGAVSPFNVENRLRQATFFVPDPWTQTPPSGNRLLKALSGAIQQAVNDNAKSKLSVQSVLSLVLGIFRYVPLTQYVTYAKLIKGIKSPGRKAIVLDKLLADTYLSLFKSHRPDFSTLFLNTGAHLQHHYMFNSTAYSGAQVNPEWYCPKGTDPLKDVLEVYDNILGAIQKENVNLIVSTGLHQVPHEELTYYWRLKNHHTFLNKIGISGDFTVETKMSRDFLIKFNNESDAVNAQRTLKNLFEVSDGCTVFSVDNRGLSLFVELIYSNNISTLSKVKNTNGDVLVNQLSEEVVFVAIKNGEHNGDGYIVSNFPVVRDDVIPLTSVHDHVVDVVENGTESTRAAI